MHSTKIKEDDFITPTEAAIASYEELEQHPAVQRFLLIIKQAEELLDYEIESLQIQQMPDFTAINTKKIRVLRDLEEAKEELLQLPGIDSKKYVIEKLELLKPKLERDQLLLKMHLDALSDLVELIKASAKNAEADGTYNVTSILAGNQKVSSESRDTDESLAN